MTGRIAEALVRNAMASLIATNFTVIEEAEQSSRALHVWPVVKTMKTAVAEHEARLSDPSVKKHWKPP